MIKNYELGIITNSFDKRFILFRERQIERKIKQYFFL